MGTGKSVVGRALAARLDRPFVDMDEAIERMLLPAPPLGFADDLPLFDG